MKSSNKDTDLDSINGELIKEILARGQYKTQVEVINAGLLLLRQQEGHAPPRVGKRRINPTLVLAIMYIIGIIVGLVAFATGALRLSG